MNKSVHQLAAEYAGRECRLDGDRARIYGRALEFARIHKVDRRGVEGSAVEFAWETVERVMLKGGEFRS